MRDATLSLAHHHPGRLRVRADALCDDVASAFERFSRVRGALGSLPGVHEVAHNAKSGSIRVDYEPGAVDPNALIEAIAHAAELRAPSAEAPQPVRRVASVVISVTRDLNALTSELTGGRADLRDLIPLAMSGAAAYSFFVKKERLPRWDNLAYWAFSLFHSLHHGEITERDRAR